ncbi:helix-turn-helix transcriptional regulator [Ktedonobacteria bacterium brp13]|nr:helix-turn-helix transcriptional regulator [Ktedonobacteria bacterium brp13]
MIRLKIKEVAALKGFSQRQLILRSGVDVRIIKRVLRDPYTNITLHTLDKFAKVLGVGADMLIESVPDPE